MEINIQVPYTTRPTMSRRTGPAHASVVNSEHIELKEKEIKLYGDRLYGQTAEAVQNHLVRRAAEHCGRKPTSDIRTLGLTFQEDFAIMYDGRLSAICFCFPSSWIPAERLGLTLAEIHQPVGDGEQLVKMSDRLARTMADPVLGKFERQVWTITNNQRLSNFPNSGPTWAPGSFDELYFRLERQTTEPLGDGRTSLFFVDVSVVPLVEVWPEHGDRILASVNSMSDTILSYKNLHAVKKILNNL